MPELDESSRDSRAMRVGRVLNEYQDRKARGLPVAEADLLAAHPDLADDLRRHFKVLGDLLPRDCKIDGLVAQGMLAEAVDPRYLARLGPYMITGFVGCGGMGIVLKAYEERLNRNVALKLLSSELTSDRTALKRFEREAQAAGSLRHPNIVTIYAVGEERGTHYLAMEYIDGPTLADVIRESVSSDRGGIQSGRSSPLSTEWIRELFRQLLEGLAGAHKAGVIHRDIKPANILLDYAMRESENGMKAIRAGDRPILPATFSTPHSVTLKIADFGLARVLTARTRVTLSAKPLGTPEYMSPEQARGEENIDHRSDLYSAGVVLYEILTGRKPFQAGTLTAITHQILHNEPDDPRSIGKMADVPLSSLALRLMAKRPEDRFASAAEAIEALEAGQRVHSLTRRRRFHRRASSGLVVLALTALAGGMIWSFSPGPEQITDVRVDPDNRLRIQVRYDDPNWKQFHAFPQEVHEIISAVLVDLDGSGKQAMVAGLKKPLEHQCLFAFGANGNPMWSLDLSSPIQWPDCGSPTFWQCAALASTELDGEPGEELVVVASDAFEYPCRISIIDPRAGRILATFWHTGQVEQLLILPEFFELKRPAIIAWGKNNKLDGFYKPRPSDPRVLTTADIVPVIMILDPVAIGGLGPPPTDRLPDVSAARPYAYAFLDAPQTHSEPQESGSIQKVSQAPYPIDDGTGPWLTFSAACSGNRGGAMLTVDRHLNLRRVVLSDLGKTDASAEYYAKCWRPIIQNRKYTLDLSH